MEDVFMCVINEEATTKIITAKSKEGEYTFVDKVIEENDNIREVLDISKEPLGIAVNEKSDIIEAEGGTKVDVEVDLNITL